MRACRFIAAAEAVILLVAALSVLPVVVCAQPQCTDEISAEVQGTTVTIHHDGALYNCCPTNFTYTVVENDSLIHVTETEILENPCFCICCVDLAVDIGDFAPWVYYVFFHWFDYETQQWQQVLLSVAVPDQGQSGLMVVSGNQLGECYESLSGLPLDPDGQAWSEDTGDRRREDAATWGSLKAVYR